MLHLGLVKRFNQRKWASAQLIVPKSGPKQFRFKVDLRPVNNEKIYFTLPMAHFETAVCELARDTAFPTTDFCREC